MVAAIMAEAIAAAVTAAVIMDTTAATGRAMGHIGVDQSPPILKAPNRVNFIHSSALLAKNALHAAFDFAAICGVSPSLLWQGRPLTDNNPSRDVKWTGQFAPDANLALERGVMSTDAGLDRL